MISVAENLAAGAGSLADLLLVCDSDSNIAFCTKFAGYAKARGISCEVVFCASDFALIRQAAHARYVTPRAELKIVSNWQKLFESCNVLRHEAILLMISGKDIPQFCDSLRKASIIYGLQRPKTVGGFIGEWISGEPQVLERACLDLLVVNRSDEVALFNSIASKLSFACDFRHIPYPFVNRHDWATLLPQEFTYRPEQTILFAEQVQVPRTPDERRVLFRALIHLARRFPERKVLFCEREIPLGGTRHRGIGNIDSFFDNLTAVAPNLLRIPGGFRKALETADCVLSVSSTACIEALLNGVPALFIKDFASSGTGKFARTGLTISLSDIYSVREIRISDDFYAELSARDSWGRLLAAALDSPRDVDVPGPMVGTFGVPHTPTIAVRDSLFEAIGGIIDTNDSLIPLVPHRFSTFERFTKGMSASNFAKGHLSDTVRIGSSNRIPERIPANRPGVYLMLVTGKDFSLHFDCKRDSIRHALVKGSISGEAFEISISKTKLEFKGVDRKKMMARWADLGFGSGSRAVMRLRSATEIELNFLNIVRDRNIKPVTDIVIERSFFPGDVHMLMRDSPVVRSTIATPGDLCVLFSPVRRRLFSTQTSLVSIVSRHSGRLHLESGSDGTIALTIGSGSNSQKHNFPWSAQNVVLIFATSTVATVIINENVVIFDNPFEAEELYIGAEDDEIEACFDVLEAYQGDFSVRTIGRVIELMTGRLYDGEAYANKHVEIPDFRAELELKLGLSDANVQVQTDSPGLSSGTGPDDGNGFSATVEFSAQSEENGSLPVGGGAALGGK